ncbi:chaperone protein DNAj, putative [Perkinsus marinus ATCC 50983]|uniref:Chaperone protein DNAj, putative n=1 Tax=Perkinsus marinus (strain ATCC 50983 / TXsc) TaxID=423536 RepID=C5K7A2_PERM5|nr:chaperone protein DNAj, putative [Perkinsus marinus ATCC 50983]EER19437.1 chaperone protein DNAj, putative [Perkinsus marinus ATCC 50983]|eukprot:XP_002787641.1 chaperone protein DNAj, putative [Perkinsus marinus ATCC 50983]
MIPSIASLSLRRTSVSPMRPGRLLGVSRIRSFANSSSSRGGKKNLYEVLGIEQKATGEEIKQAYRDMAKKWHPDRNPDDPLAGDRFKEVCEAYATLGNQWKRTIYDQDMQFGAALDSQAKGEDWKEHYNKETPEQRNARRERYRRYAKGERNDVPQDEMPLSMMIKLLIAVPVVVWIGCILAPEFGPGERPSEPSRNDPGFDDKSVPLTRAYYNPILERWEKLKGVEEPPDPEKFYDVYEKNSAYARRTIDRDYLPQNKLTVLDVPKTKVHEPSVSVDDAGEVTPNKRSFYEGLAAAATKEKK